MKDRLIIFFKKYPAFLFLLPVFFVLHGCTENYGFVPATDAIFLTGIYLAFSLLFFLISWLFYKNWMKAGLIAFLVMAFHFFFGSIQDGLRNLFPEAFITKYVFILPFFFCLLLLTVFILKKSKKPLHRLAFYLNFLFLLLIIFDLVSLAGKSVGDNKKEITLSKEFVPCTDCPKPDVYVIIADEYAGDMELKDLFHFNDSSFFRQITERGFHVIPNSSANYNYTPYSVASTLNMGYLDLDRTGKQPLLAYTYELIRNNKLLQFLLYHQYKFYNYSIFSFKDQPAHVNETFLPVRTRLITAQTFVSRVEKELRYILLTKFESESELRRNTYYNRNNNERLFDLTVKVAGINTKQPKFVLTHLMMPHYPYYYDKNGNEFPFETLPETKDNQYNQHNYIEYLQYSNRKLLELVDQILKRSSTPPIIVLMGDHGFRHFHEPVDSKYQFCNFVSVHLPDKNYHAFTDSLTNVNLLRTLLNTSFRQQLSYLQDTAFIMENP